jgi:Bacterial pre-peptidase C-terminal domain
MLRKSGRKTLHMALLAAFLGTALVAAGPAASSSYTITTDGTPLTVTTTEAGENAKATFSGTTGQRVSLDITDVTIGSSGCCSMQVWIAKPDGTLLFKKTYVGTSGAFINPKTLPTNGTYKIFLDPEGTAKGSATLRLYTVPADLNIPATADGSANLVDIDTPGQNARLPFSATEGQRVALEVSGVTMAGVKVSIKKPDGTNLLGPLAVDEDGAFLGPKGIPADGTYKVLVDPQSRYTGEATVRVHSVPADVTGTIVADDPAQVVSIPAAGQVARLSFSGSEGDRVSLDISGVTIPNAQVKINKPDGSQLASVTVSSSEAFLDTKTLPVTGTYKVVVDPTGADTGDITLQLYDVPADASGPIAVETPLASSLAVPGRNASYTFNGTAGNRVAVDVSANSFDSVKVGVKKPDGTYLISPVTITLADGFLDTKMLPVSGTYKVTVDPVGNTTGSVTLTRYNVPADATGSVTVDGSSQSISTSVPGQNATLTFSADAAQDLFLDLSSVTIGSDPASGAKVSVLKPDGSKLVFPQAFGTTGWSDSLTTTVAGTYTIVIDPQGDLTGGVTAQLTSA